MANARQQFKVRLKWPFGHAADSLSWSLMGGCQTLQGSEVLTILQHRPDRPGTPRLVSFEELYADRPQSEVSKLIALFGLGRIVLSIAAIEAIADGDIEPVTLLRRHATGDWGDVDAEDRRLNDAAAAGDGSRMYSAYVVGCDKRVWVITEGDRSGTLVILPEEYM